MVPRHHRARSSKLGMALLSTETPTETGPMSLELFSHAAADLDERGEMELRRYQVCLFNHE